MPLCGFAPWRLGVRGRKVASTLFLAAALSFTLADFSFSPRREDAKGATTVLGTGRFAQATR
jgi:hypothetical protein